MPRGRKPKSASGDNKRHLEDDSPKSKVSEKGSREPKTKMMKSDPGPKDDPEEIEDEMQGIQAFMNQPQMSNSNEEAGDEIDDEFASIESPPEMKPTSKPIQQSQQKPKLIEASPEIKTKQKVKPVQPPSEVEAKSQSINKSRSTDSASKQQDEIEEDKTDEKLSRVEEVSEEEKFPKVANADKGTDGRCGRCEGCSRNACRECSACKRQEFNECIDLYCTNEKSGLFERANLRQMYLESLKKQKEAKSENRVWITEGDDDSSSGSSSDDETKNSKPDVDNLSIENQPEPPTPEKPTKTVQRSKPTDEGGDSPSKKAAPNFSSAVYGGSHRATKARRCGECEGCTRDDCGECPACLDKPRFGGKGTKKKACQERFCRLKTYK